MSSRRTLNTNEGKTSNPAKKFLQWKSNDKKFSYYNKELKQNIEVELPFKFQFLEHFNTVKGWNDATSSGIYSNEVMFTSKEELTVKTFGGLEIARGLYSDIRSKVRDAGGKYHRSVYAVDDNGDIVNIQMKGAVVSAYSVFMDGDKKTNVKGHKHLIENNWIVIKSFQDLKKGATKYSVPIFEIGEPFTQDEFTLADDNYKVISNYFDTYKGKIDVSEVEVNEEPEENDLDF
jgi:hypothetical protein